MFTKVISHRLVKNEDLNHHRTLFAGRCAEWVVESGFIALANYLDPHNIVCLKMHGLEFLHPIHAGDVLRFESMLVLARRSTVDVFVRVHLQKNSEMIFCEGFLTFCHVDENARPVPHNLSVVAETDEEKELQEKAQKLSYRDKNAESKK